LETAGGEKQGFWQTAGAPSVFCCIPGTARPDSDDRAVLPQSFCSFLHTGGCEQRQQQTQPSESGAAAHEKLPDTTERFGFYQDAGFHNFR
jgi:hypothetical protein